MASLSLSSNSRLCSVNDSPIKVTNSLDSTMAKRWANGIFRQSSMSLSKATSCRRSKSRICRFQISRYTSSMTSSCQKVPVGHSFNAGEKSLLFTVICSARVVPNSVRRIFRCGSSWWKDKNVRIIRYLCFSSDDVLSVDVGRGDKLVPLYTQNNTQKVHELSARSTKHSKF